MEIVLFIVAVLMSLVLFLIKALCYTVCGLWMIYKIEDIYERRQRRKWLKDAAKKQGGGADD